MSDECLDSDLGGHLSQGIFVLFLLSLLLFWFMISHCYLTDISKVVMGRVLILIITVGRQGKGRLGEAARGDKQNSLNVPLTSSCKGDSQAQPVNQKPHY